MRGVAEQHELSIGPAIAVDANDFVLDQLVERTKAGQDAPGGGIRARPCVAKCLEVASIERCTALRRAARGERVRAAIDRKRAEDAGRRPGFGARRDIAVSSMRT